MRIIRVGVAGLGTVGSEVVRLLQARRNDFLRRLGAELRIDAVCDNKVGLKSSRLGLSKRVRRTRRYRDLIRDPDLDIVVETMGGLEEARNLALGALREGKHVVTANKRVLAHYWSEIIRTAQKANRRIYFEASVAGGIPILQAVHQSLAANRIHRVLGILNGTTNFILTQMAHQNLPMKKAVARAQKLGLAEKNPRLDLDGTDAAHKVAIIASLLTGQWVRPTDVRHTGILSIQPEDMSFAISELRCTIRLLGVVDIDWDRRPAQVAAYVAPALIPLDHPLAAVHGENNAVMVQTSAAGDLMFYGKGAGAGPAASAVVGDLFMLSQEILQRRHTSVTTALWGETRRARVIPIEETVSGFYLHLQVVDRPGVLAKIAGILGRNQISIAQIYQGQGRGSRVPVFITTHPTRQKAMNTALREISALSAVAPTHTCLRTLS